jgi:hypothetical protein
MIKMALRKILEREPLLKRRKIFASESPESLGNIESLNEIKEKEPESISERPARPESGKTYSEQGDTEYCLECCEGHTMSALTELRHAIDRCRSADGEITEGVTEKVRVAVAELMGIPEDVRNTSDAPPKVKKELNEILDEIRWIRKDCGLSGKGLTIGRGTLQDLEELRSRVHKIQAKAYALVDDCPTCKRISRKLGESL